MDPDLDSSSDEEYFPAQDHPTLPNPFDTITIETREDGYDPEVEDPLDEDEEDPEIVGERALEFEEDEEDDEYVPSEDGADNDDEYIDEASDDDNAAADSDIMRIFEQTNPTILHRVAHLFHRAAGVPSSFTRPQDFPRRRRRLQKLPPTPYAAGRALANSGEFGMVDDRRAKKRRYEGARTISQLARFRELGWRRENPLCVTKGWIPDERTTSCVAQYDRHVYSGQFSHDGSFFYTACQDFRCRMYQTLNPSSPKEWKLYKVKNPTLQSSSLTILNLALWLFWILAYLDCLW